MKIAEARQLAAKWQAILRLRDWRIHVRWRKPEDFEDYSVDPETEGFVDWFTEHGIITLILRRDASEYTILHELLHCVLEGHKPRPKAYDQQYEFGINTLTDVIMREPELSDGDLAKITRSV